MLVAIDALTKKVAAEPLKDRLVRRRLRVQEGVQGADGFLGRQEAGDHGHAHFAERTIRTIKEAVLRRIAAGAGRRGQWRLTLADILSQINGRKHATTQAGEPRLL